MNYKEMKDIFIKIQDEDEKLKDEELSSREFTTALCKKLDLCSNEKEKEVLELLHKINAMELRNNQFFSGIQKKECNKGKNCPFMNKNGECSICDLEDKNFKFLSEIYDIVKNKKLKARIADLLFSINKAAKDEKKKYITDIIKIYTSINIFNNIFPYNSDTFYDNLAFFERGLILFSKQTCIKSEEIKINEIYEKFIKLEEDDYKVPFIAKVLKTAIKEKIINSSLCASVKDKESKWVEKQNNNNCDVLSNLPDYIISPFITEIICDIFHNVYNMKKFFSLFPGNKENTLFCYFKYYPMFFEYQKLYQAIKESNLIFYFCNLSFYESDGRRKGIISGENTTSNDTQIIKMMVKFYDKILLIYACPIILEGLNYLTDTYNISYKDIETIVNGSKYFNEDRKETVCKGLFAGFSKDFITSLNLLIPQFENLIRTILKQNNKKTTSYSPDERRETENGLSSLVKNYYNTLVDILGEDTTFEIKALLCDPIGPNLRNNVAHGLLNDSQMNDYYSIYFWWFFLKQIYMKFYENKKDISLN